MDAEYDFVVVGAGPSGLQFARAVSSRSDHSVVVLERNDALADNDKSTGGTFPEVVEGYDLPEEVVMSEAASVTFEGPTEESRHEFESYVLDFPRLVEALGEEASSQGVEIRTGARVTGPVVEDGRVRGVRYHETGSRSESEVRGRVTVDASGPSAVLTSELGLFDTDAARHGVGLEIEAEGEYDTDDTLLFRFDHEVAPGGYAWTFPAGENAFKAGVCWMDAHHETRAGADSIHERVERWVEADPRWTVERVRARHAGEGVWNDSLNRRAADGFLAVGDAISSINPLFGEGIRPGMESADLAAEVAVPAVADGDCSRERLREYERRWNDAKGWSWKLQRVVSELLYDFDADQQDEFVRRVDDLSRSAAERLRRYDLDPLSLARLYPFKRKDLSKLPRVVSYLGV